MKKALLTIFVLFFGGLQPCLQELTAEEGDGFNFDLGRYYMSVTPKVLEDGVQTDYSFGFFYKEEGKIAGEIRFRQIKGTENDEVWDISDSLMTRDRKVYEVFLLPFNWHFFRKAGFTLRAGAGLYYDYNELKERGYFNDSTLSEPAGTDTYNAYINDFSGHAIGPLLDVGLSWTKGFFYSSLSFGVVPAFYLNRNQTWKLSPLMTPPSYKVASDGFCGPYYYLNLDVALNFKYITLLLTLLNEYSSLSYTAAGFDSTSGAWADVDVKTENKVLALEISLLFNLGQTKNKKSDFKPLLGYGRTFDDISGGSNYFLLGVKKMMF